MYVICTFDRVLIIMRFVCFLEQRQHHTSRGRLEVQISISELKRYNFLIKLFRLAPGIFIPYSLFLLNIFRFVQFMLNELARMRFTVCINVSLLSLEADFNEHTLEILIGLA